VGVWRFFLSGTSANYDGYTARIEEHTLPATGGKYTPPNRGIPRYNLQASNPKVNPPIVTPRLFVRSRLIFPNVLVLFTACLLDTEVTFGVSGLSIVRASSVRRPASL
jgi:hypothetical protein